MASEPLTTLGRRAAANWVHLSPVSVCVWDRSNSAGQTRRLFFLCRARNSCHTMCQHDKHPGRDCRLLEEHRICCQPFRKPHAHAMVCLQPQEHGLQLHLVGCLLFWRHSTHRRVSPKWPGNRDIDLLLWGSRGRSGLLRLATRFCSWLVLSRSETYHWYSGVPGVVV